MLPIIPQADIFYAKIVHEVEILKGNINGGLYFELILSVH